MMIGDVVSWIFAPRWAGLSDEFQARFSGRREASERVSGHLPKDGFKEYLWGEDGLGEMVQAFVFDLIRYVE